MKIELKTMYLPILSIILTTFSIFSYIVFANEFDKYNQIVEKRAFIAESYVNTNIAASHIYDMENNSIKNNIIPAVHIVIIDKK